MTDEVFVSLQTPYLKENVVLPFYKLKGGELSHLLKYLFMISCGEVRITSEQVRLSQVL